VTPPTLPYQADYAAHPAFAPHLTWDLRFDGAVDEAVTILDKLLLDLESALTLKQLSLAQALDRVRQPVRLAVDLLVVAHDATGSRFRPFADRFYRELMRIVLDDLAYFGRRNGYQPLINNAAEMALRNELARNGFVRFTLQPEEIAALRRQVKPYVGEVEARYQRGQRSREQLSINEVDVETRALVSEVIQRRGLNKAVSDVRHERAQASGLSIELSPHDADWWHSRYEDVGIKTPPRTSYFHNDESRDAYKAIICLDDVDEDGGPFSFVPPSYALHRPRFEWVTARAILTTLAADEIRATMTDAHPSRGVWTSQLTRRFIGMLPARLRLSSHFGYDLLDGTPIAAALLRDEVKLLGPAGQAIAFDGGRLVHRGGMVRRGYRTALQVVFEVNKAVNDVDLR
jgi:hypothetical protein